MCFGVFANLYLLAKCATNWGHCDTGCKKPCESAQYFLKDYYHNMPDKCTVLVSPLIIHKFTSCTCLYSLYQVGDSSTSSAHSECVLLDLKGAVEKKRKWQSDTPQAKHRDELLTKVFVYDNSYNKVHRVDVEIQKSVSCAVENWAVYKARLSAWKQELIQQ